MAEGVGGAAAVREELPGLRGHGEHLTSVRTWGRGQSRLYFLCSTLPTAGQKNAAQVQLRRNKASHGASCASSLVLARCTEDAYHHFYIVVNNIYLKGSYAHIKTVFLTCA